MRRFKIAQALLVLFSLLLTGCDWDFDYDDICWLLDLLFYASNYSTPSGLSRNTYNSCADLIPTVANDFDDDARFIALLAFTIWISGVDEYNNPTGPLPYSLHPKATTVRQVAAYSNAPQLATLTGTATSTATGWHFDLHGTNPAAGFGAVETMSLDLKVVPGGPATYTGTLNILPSVSTKGTDYALKGTQTQSLITSPFFSPGIQKNVSLNSGEFIQEPATDLSLGGLPPLMIRRTYGSLIKLNGFTGALGDNWMHNYEIKLAVSDTAVTVQALGGAAIDFVKSGSNWVLSDTQPRPYQLANSGANFQFYDPAQNLIYTFTSTGTLTRVEDRNGNALTVTPGPNGPTQITDGLGRTLTFTYNAQGKLASISDQSNRSVTYNYTGVNLTSFTDAAGKTTSYTYTNSGGFTSLLTSIKRPLGNVPITNVVDTVGRVTKQTDGDGNATTFAYTASPISTTVTDALGNQTKTTHTDVYHHDSVTDPTSKTINILWNAANQPTQLTDRLGGKTTATYDTASGTVTSATGADGSTVGRSYITQTQGAFTFYLISKQTLPQGITLSYQYDANGNQTSQTDANGVTTQNTFNSRGQILTQKNALGGVTTNTYNSDGTLATVKSPAGDTTAYSYDSLKRVSKITFADGSTQSFNYDALDRVISVSTGSGTPATTAFDDNGNVKSSGSASFTYDGNDNPLTRTANGATRSVAYDALNRAKTLTNEAGEKQTIGYDAPGRVNSLADGSGAAYKIAWNAQGFAQSVTDPLSKVTSFTTDAVGRILSSVSPLNERTAFAFDKLGRQTSITSPAGNAAGFTWSGNYISRVDLPLGISGSYTFNAMALLTGITDPNGNVWKQSFDTQGRRNGLTDPLGHATTIQYDNRNRAASATNPLGTVTFTYDSSGNLIKQTFSDGSSLAYQVSGGRVTGADNLVIAYDANNRVSSSNGIANTRDAVGRLLTITYASGKIVTYQYNSLGLLSTIQDWAGGKTTFLYDAAQRLLSIQRPNGTKTVYTRDANGRVTSITETLPGTTYSINLQIDSEGNVKSADRNLPLAPSPAPGLSSYSFDAADQLGGATYDAMGRLTADTLRTYKWDLASRLLSVAGADGTAQFTYDGLGMRVSRTSGGATENYVWNYAHDTPAIAVVQSGGADSRYNIFLSNGTWLYTIQASSGARSFAHFDEAGSTTFLTDDNGAVSDSYGITPFGESVIHKGTSPNPFTFHGAYGVMQEGGSSLYYVRARYFDSASARFISRDPVSRAEPLQINPYQFAFNNPISFRDPTGRSSECGCWGYGSSVSSVGYDFSNGPSQRSYLSIPESGSAMRLPRLSSSGRNGYGGMSYGGSSFGRSRISTNSLDSILGAPFQPVRASDVLPYDVNFRSLETPGTKLVGDGAPSSRTLFGRE